MGLVNDFKRQFKKVIHRWNARFPLVFPPEKPRFLLNPLTFIKEQYLCPPQNGHQQADYGRQSVSKLKVVGYP